MVAFPFEHMACCFIVALLFLFSINSGEEPAPRAGRMIGLWLVNIAYWGTAFFWEITRGAI